MSDATSILASNALANAIRQSGSLRNVPHKLVLDGETVDLPELDAIVLGALAREPPVLRRIPVSSHTCIVLVYKWLRKVRSTGGGRRRPACDGSLPDGPAAGPRRSLPACDQRPDAGDDGTRDRRHGEEDIGPDHQVDSGGHHGGGVDQRRHRCGAGHRIRELPRRSSICRHA